MKKTSRSLAIIVFFLIAATAGLVWYFKTQKIESITNFNECAAAGYPIMESYPPQCRTADGRTFTQDVARDIMKNDVIRVFKPQPHSIVTNPLVILGEARGTWFFEASFPVHLDDASGAAIATGVAQAQGEWMTEEFVPFQVTLDIPNAFSGEATLVLEKDNPSGLPEHADSLGIPVTIKALPVPR